ncbi:MAG: agmatinase [Desulfobacteraceae bacterium]|nr:agmatinase [Desulfobacteraceae bacterium]
MIPDHKINKLKNDDVALLGLPLDHNSSYQRGPASAPSYIRERLYSDSSNLSTENGLDLKANNKWHNFGDLKFSNVKDSFTIIEKSITQILDHDGRVLSLGGDHSVTYPLIKAYSKKYNKLTLLHFDAHPDLYNELNGNPFSHASPFARIMEENLVDNLIQLGIRTINPHQREQINKFNVQTIEMKDFNPDCSLNLSGPLYISFDMDALDPAFAPGVSHHEPGGFTTRQVLEIIQGIDISKKSDITIVGADIVELNPLNDINLMTAMTAAKFVKEILSKMI